MSRDTALDTLPTAYAQALRLRDEGQLDAEIAVGAWVPVGLDEEIVFDDEIDRKWERAFARLGLSMAGSMMRGGGEA